MSPHSITVEFFVHNTTPKGNSTLFYVHKRIDTTTKNRFFAYCPWSDGNLGWFYTGNNEEYKEIEHSFSSSEGKWTHVAFVGEGKSKPCSIFINGTLVQQKENWSEPDLSWFSGPLSISDESELFLDVCPILRFGKGC